MTSHKSIAFKSRFVQAKFVMIQTDSVVRQINSLKALDISAIFAVLEEYGDARSEILGYVLSFRDHISMPALDVLLRFLVFLILIHEQEGFGRIDPKHETIWRENRSARKMVEYILTEERGNITKSANLWVKGFEEQYLLAYAMNDILKRYDMDTEEGLQIYIAVVSLIRIFSAEAKDMS